LIRSLACLLIIIFSSALGASISQSTHYSVLAPIAPSGVPVLVDPLNVTGAATAFNYTYSTADIYTNNTIGFVATPSLGNSHPGTQLTWFSTINRTKDGSKIPGTAFNFTSTSPVFNIDHTLDRQEVNWTLTIPQSNCASCSLAIRFNLFGNLTKGTSENFTLTPSTNNTNVIPGIQTIFLGNQSTPVYVCGLSRSTISAGCAQPDVTIPLLSKWVGVSLRLSFRFGWNSTNEPMLGSIGEVVVASIDNTPKASSSNFMTQGSDPTKVIHTAKFFPIGYNTTVPSHVWSNEVINFYYPSGYNLTQLALNTTTNPIFPSGNRAPFEKTACNDQPLCTQSLIALNMSEIIPSNFVRNSTIFMSAISQNSLVRLNPVASGVATTFFVSGDTLGVNVTNRPSVANAPTSLKTGRLNITFVDRQGPETPTGQAFSTTTVIGGLFNFTLPSDCGTNNLRCGQWTITATFGGGLDLGAMSSSFSVDLIQMNSFSAGGSNNGVTATGTLTNSSGSASAATNGIVFAIDSGTPANNPITNTTKNPSSSGLYISNVTLVNGAFAQGQQLIMTFTLVNPTSSAFNATVIIQHEWPGSLTHGVNATIHLGAGILGGLPFTSGPQAYQAGITLTPSGVRLVLTSLTTGNSESVPVSLGTDPVVSTRQHAGLFKITVVTLTGTSVISTNSLESPPYAYVFGLASATNRYLAYSSPFSTDTNGKFSLTLTSDSILAANKLVMFALARDSRGIVLTSSPLNTGLSDSTTLQSTMDSIGPVAESSSVTATLHLKSNSTKFTEIITVDLYLQGSGKLAEQPGISISPGTNQDVTLSFKAPSTPGQYALSISSPQYGGGPLASQTLQVMILQSNLQILIPAAIGIVAAIIILGVYLVKKQPETIETQEKTKLAGSKSKTPGSGNSPSKSLT